MAGKSLFGKENQSGSAGSKPLLSNSSMFTSSGGSLAEHKPIFGNSNIFVSSEHNPAWRSGSSFVFTSVLENKPCLRNTNMCMVPGSSRCRSRPKLIPKKKFQEVQDSVEGSTNKPKGDASEAVLLGGMEKLQFNFENSKLQETQKEEIKSLVSDLHGLFECPVCLGCLDLSLKQCGNGHAICSSCVINLENCPTCQHAYLPNKPILLCKILDRLPKQCSFADKGCDEILKNNKEEHETFCKFRPASCKFPNCKWKDTVKTVVDHVTTCRKSTVFTLCEIHFPNIKVNKMYRFQKTQDTSLYTAVILGNQLFWKLFHWDSVKKMISYKLFHITPSKPKQKYFLVVSFKKGDFEYKTCIPASYDIDCHDKKSEIMIFLPDRELERFYDAEAKGYCYTLHMIVEDVCEENKSP